MVPLGVSTPGRALPVQPSHRSALVHLHAEVQRDAAQRPHQAPGMDRRVGRLQDAGEEGSRPGAFGDLLPAQAPVGMNLVGPQRVHEVVPDADVGGTGRSPDRSVALEARIEPVAAAQGLDVVDGGEGGPAETQRLFGAAHLPQQGEVGPQGHREARVGAAAAAAAALRLDEDDVGGRRRLLEVDGGPQSGVAPAHDAHVTATVPVEGRGDGVVFRARILEPEALELRTESRLVCRHVVHFPCAVRGRSRRPGPALAPVPRDPAPPGTMLSPRSIMPTRVVSP